MRLEIALVLLSGVCCIVFLSFVGMRGNSWQDAKVPPLCPLRSLARCVTVAVSSHWSPTFDTSQTNDGHLSSRWNSVSAERSGAWLEPDFSMLTLFHRIFLQDASEWFTGDKVWDWDGGIWRIPDGITIGMNTIHTLLALTAENVWGAMVDLMRSSPHVSSSLSEFEVHNTSPSQSDFPRVLDNPQPGSFQSGIGLIQGWACEAETIAIELDGTVTFVAAYGTTRLDTQTVCGDADNGFGVTVNWNLLGDGQHTVRALADGVEFAFVTVTVTTLGLGEFPQEVQGEFVLSDFPLMSEETTIRWQPSLQNFVMTQVADNNSPCPDLACFATKLEALDWLTYAPTNFNPTLGCPEGFPTEASIRTDLEIAFQHGFEGLITFAADCTLKEIPRIAREVGFRGVIMGLFLFDEILQSQEIENAKAVADYVDGYGIGNEGLIGCGGDFYTSAQLEQVMDEMRNATHKPVTTSEQIEDYLNGGCLDGFLLTRGDWVFPIVHPFNNQIRSPEAGVNFTENQFQQLSTLTNKPLFFKETGWPTAGDPAATEENQEAYFVLLKGGQAQYAYFEGFDQPFKPTSPSPWEPFWGLLREDRTPKLLLQRHQP